MERKSLFARQSASVHRAETFAITVESYDTTSKPNVVRGRRVDNGEEVSVFLRDIDVQYRGRLKRSEIADFAAPRRDRQHPGTALGGTLLIQEAVRQAEGLYGARWIQSLSHTSGEAEVFQATIHVTPVKRSNSGVDYSIMTVLHDGDFHGLSEEMLDHLKITPPFKVDTTAELREALTSLLNDGIGVGVRVSTAEGFDAMYVSKRKDMTSAQAVDEFFRNMGDLGAALDAGDIAAEVIPFGNVWAGPSTTETMVKNAVMASRIGRFNEMRTGRDGHTYPVSIFRPAIVAVRLSKPDEHGQRAAFFTHFEPLFTTQPVPGLVNALAYAQTDLLKPVAPRPEGKPGAEQQQQQAQAAGPQATAPSPAPTAQAPRVRAAAPAQARAPAAAAPAPANDVASFDAGDDMGFNNDPLMAAIGEPAAEAQVADASAARAPSRRYSGRRG
jgi:hypothetical protein